MGCIGIIAEYDPFHTGHAFHIAQSRQLMGEDADVIVVMSGNWVQRAGCAAADKWTRARAALLGGADLVLELPTVWAVSTAESFSGCGVSILNGTGVVDVLSFGSESGDLISLEAVSRCLSDPAYQNALRTALGTGSTFAASRQEAVRVLLGKEYSDLLAYPNNNLGIEYIKALRALGSPIQPITVRREGAGHNSESHVNGETQFLSSSQLRDLLKQGDCKTAERYLGSTALPLFPKSSDAFPEMNRVECAVLARFRSMSAKEWALLPDAGEAEGLPRRLEWAGRKCISLEDFFKLAKTKRYTHARLRRLALWAYLGLTSDDVPSSPPYLRVLGFNARGQEVLRDVRDRASLPILTKPAHVHRLGSDAERLFEVEARCTDLYDLCCNPVPSPGREWTTGPVRIL